MWYDCEDCVFGSNSPRQAKAHADATGHKIEEQGD